MKRKLLTIVCLTMAVLLSSVMPALACTEVYVGKDVSEDGSIIMARSNDNQAMWPNYIDVVEAVKDEPGRTLPINDAGTVLIPIKDSTFQYQTTPWMDYTTAVNGLTRDGTCGTNENGVIMTMAVTAFVNEKAEVADPLIEDGLSEQAACDLVLAQAETAREGVEILAGIIDEYGNAQVNIATIADRNEAWYMEMYTGHQYAAVKLPDDKVSVFGNEFTLEFLEDYEDVITSKELESLPEKKGFIVKDSKKRMDLYETYSGQALMNEYCRMRTWIGHKELAPSTYEDYDDSVLYPLVFVPDEKVSVQYVMELIRNRYEGTEYSPEETGRYDMRVIGTDVAMSVHVLQVYPDLPKEMSAVLWECTGPAVCGVFVPVSNASTKAADVYAANQSADEKDAYEFPSDKYPWYAIKELNTIGLTDYATYGQPVRECFHQAETAMCKGMAAALKEAAKVYKKSPEDAAKLLTDYCVKVQTQAFADETAMLNKVRWYESFCSNTMKLGRNPETGEYTDEKRVYDPVEVEIDTKLYDYTFSK